MKGAVTNQKPFKGTTRSCWEGPKEFACQTENRALSSFGHVSDGAEHNLAFEGDTLNSTNLNLTTELGGRPNRIQSANRSNEAGSFSNIMSHHGPSHPDLRQNINIDQRNQNIRPTKSAANKYRHMLGHDDAI